MAKSLDRVYVATATTGTGTMTLGAAIAANVITFAQAGAVDGDVVNYVIEDGADFEVGQGVIGGGATTLSRVTVYLSKASATIGTTKLNLTGAARIIGSEPANLFNHQFPTGELIKTGAYTVVADDHNRLLVANSAGALTFSLTAAATLGTQFAVFVKNIGVGTLTIDPNGAEQIDGVASITFKTGQSGLILGNGTLFRSVLVDRLSLAFLSDIDFVTIPPATGDGLVYDGTALKWKPGAAGGGMFRGDNGTVGSRSGDIFRVNKKVLSANVTIAATENASATGPLEVATGITLEVATGGTLVIL